MTSFSSQLGGQSQSGEKEADDWSFSDLFECWLGCAPEPPAEPQATITRILEQGTDHEILIIVQSGRSNDNIHITKNDDGGVTVDVNGEKYSFTASQANRLVVRAGDGNDIIKVDRDVTARLTLEGGDGNDVIYGSDSNEVIRGGDGNDKIYARGGRDVIIAGNGDDTVHGGDGDDNIYGLNGNDTLYGDDGRDYIDGGRDNDKIYGGDGRDALIGGRGDDQLYGGANDDFSRRRPRLRQGGRRPRSRPGQL